MKEQLASMPFDDHVVVTLYRVNGKHGKVGRTSSDTYTVEATRSGRRKATSPKIKNHSTAYATYRTFCDRARAGEFRGK